MQLALPPKAERSTRPFDISRWGLRFAALTYLLAMIAIPVVIIFLNGFREGLVAFWDNFTNPAALGAMRLSIQTAAIMALVNIVMGTLTAYVLISYRFPGKSLFNLLIDLPFAIPTLVTGVMLVLLYGPQTAIGGFFENTWGIRILYAQPGIVLALLFLGYPFVIRAVQPVLQHLDMTQQEAAHTLGASSMMTFWRVIFPAIRPAIIASGLLSFARALGEFGAIVIVSGNIPLRTQTASVYIYGQIEAGDVAAASGISVVLLFVALAATLAVDLFYREKSDA